MHGFGIECQCSGDEVSACSVLLCHVCSIGAWGQHRGEKAGLLVYSLENQVTYGESR